MQTIRFEIEGKRPLLMHSLRLLNKFDPLSREKATLTSARKKSDADQMRIQEIDWLGSMYFDPQIGPYIPSDNIEAMIVEGAKISKGGKDVKRAVTILEDRAPLRYEGPRDLEGLYGDGCGPFVDTRGVRNQAQRVMRCRPIFMHWALTFTASFNTTVIKNAETLARFVTDAGDLVGLGDYRPKFGRFSVISVAEVDAP